MLYSTIGTNWWQSLDRQDQLDAVVSNSHGTAGHHHVRWSSQKATWHLTPRPNAVIQRVDTLFVTNEGRCYQQHQSPKEAHQVTRSAQSPEHAAAWLTAPLPDT